MTRHHWVWLALAGALLGLIAAPLAAQTDKATYLAEARQGVVEITPEQLRTRLAGELPPLVLDVRTFTEREQGRTVTEQEIHIPRGFLEMKAWEQLPTGQEVVIYCGTGGRSALAAQTLKAMGWEQVMSLQGGITAYYESVGEDCGCIELPFAQ
ncbi:rhodanese-like domain-containing protein [Ferrimonas pelagia]|uniref:Rhodanese domain-containing protein n=1 Tax=Ferrimonas pelagia TaxID=1177826 RepID=A0ABP9F9P9_9GAMM